MAIVPVRKSIKKTLTSFPNPYMMMMMMKKKQQQKRAIRSNPLLPSSSSPSSFGQTLAMPSPPSPSSASVSRFPPPSQVYKGFELEMESSSSCFPYDYAAALTRDEDHDDEEFRSTASRPCTPKAKVVWTPAQSRVSPSPTPPGYPLPAYCKPPSTSSHYYNYYNYYSIDDDEDIDEELMSTAASRHHPCTPPPGFPLPVYVYDKPTEHSSDPFPCARPHPRFCHPISLIIMLCISLLMFRFQL